ncbi:Glutathione S-transferase family protein [Corchorus olitorius]|uniref:Glutathione S-transferase family protein n=1 Tax=Corchorus olitorius TaxID=93759 RepID=A0A1R3JC84_9ROSI|nr:Glutathione S-transferase family protein [Corchorus olitorius]
MAESNNNDVNVLGSWARSFVFRPKIAPSLKFVNFEYMEENILEAKMFSAILVEAKEAKKATII